MKESWPRASADVHILKPASKMGGDVAKQEEMEKSVPEQEERRRSNDPGGDIRPLTGLASEGTEAEDDNKELASSSGCEQIQEIALFSPGFSSMAARAGWDAEALLMAALSRSPMDSESRPEILHASQIAQVDARKRDKHTPLSSARR